MSDRIVQSYYDCDGRSEQSMRSYQSVWMAHWTRTSSNAAPQTHNHLACACVSKEDDCGTKQNYLQSGLQVVSDISKSAKGFRDCGTPTFGIMKESLATSSKNFQNEKSNCHPFSMLHCNSGGTSGSINRKEICHMEAVSPDIGHTLDPATALHSNKSHFSSILRMAPPASEPSSSANRLQLVGNLQNLARPVKSQMYPGDSSISDFRPLQDNFPGQESHDVPYKCDCKRRKPDGKGNASPSPRCRREVSQTGSGLPSKQLVSNANLMYEDCDYHRHSTLLVCEEKIDGHSNSGRSEALYLNQNNTSRFQHGPSTSNNPQPTCTGEECQRIQNRPGTKLFPCRSNVPEMSRSEILHHGQCSQIKIPRSGQDVDGMRICTTMDGDEGISRGPSQYSQTTHSLLITKKTDVKLGEENQILGGSRVSAQFVGNVVGGLGNLSPLLLYSQQVKLQSLSSFTDTEGKGNDDDIICSKGEVKNESSADTDTMDMDAFNERNKISGKYCSASKKAYDHVELAVQEIVVEPDCPPQVGRKRLITELPDINLELPVLPAGTSSTDNTESSTSRTQSLDMELLLSRAEQPSISKSNHCPDSPRILEPSCSWVKRLKLSAPGASALGVKSSNLDEASSHGKMNEFLNKIITSRVASSELKLGNVEEFVTPVKTLPSFSNHELPSADMAQKGQANTLSHFWIRRWCHNQVGPPQKKPKVVVGEPESSKAASVGSRKKQCPSIAAMALMGKAMNGFQPCKFQKRGSFVVWNNKA